MPTDLHTCFDIEQVKSRYCRLIDAKDWAGVAEVLTEDVVLDLGGGDQMPPIVGRDAALAAVRESVADAVTVHQVHSPEFHIDGDDALVVWAAQERVKWDNGTALTAYGHYHDRWVRGESGWRIAELRLTHLLSDVD